MGAWIETEYCDPSSLPRSVAPYVGAWIETTKLEKLKKYLDVAPYVGAWIETSNCVGSYGSSRSHPMWVRGLKHEIRTKGGYIATVAPYVGAWIETIVR